MRCWNPASHAERLCWKAGNPSPLCSSRTRVSNARLRKTMLPKPSAECFVASVLPKNKKAALEGAALEPVNRIKKLRGFRGFFLHRAGVETLGIDVAVDELDYRHRRVVTVAETSLDDASITALPVLVPAGENIE